MSNLDKEFGDFILKLKPKKGYMFFSETLKFPNHYKIYCDRKEMEQKFEFKDESKMSCMGPYILIKFKNHVYYYQLVDNYGWGELNYPGKLIDSKEIPNETWWNELEYFISEPRKKKLKEDQKKQANKELKQWHDTYIKSIKTDVTIFLRKLTRWYFKEIVNGSRFNWDNNIDWINIDKLVEISWWPLMKKMKEYYESDWMKELNPNDTEYFEEFQIELEYDMFHDNFPYFWLFARMIEDNVKDSYPNGDCYSGSHEQDINFKANWSLFCYVREKMCKKEHLSKVEGYNMEGFEINLD